MYLIFPLIGLALAAIVLVLALVFNFIIAPLRTLAMILQKIAGIIGVLFTGLALYFHFVEHLAIPFEVYAIVGLCIAVGILTQWFIERPTRAERKAAEQQQRQLELQRQQYEMSIRQQALDDIARQNTDADAARVNWTPQVATLEDGQAQASIRMPASVGRYLIEHEGWPVREHPQQPQD